MAGLGTSGCGIGDTPTGVSRFGCGGVGVAGEACVGGGSVSFSVPEASPARRNHAGALLALQHDTGWDPRTADIIVGSSSGSIVAALLRADLSTDDLAA